MRFHGSSSPRDIVDQRDSRLQGKTSFDYARVTKHIAIHRRTACSVVPGGSLAFWFAPTTPPGEGGTDRGPRSEPPRAAESNEGGRRMATSEETEVPTPISSRPRARAAPPSTDASRPR